MSKECEYCFKQHKRHEYIAEDGDTTASLRIDKDMLFIELKWYDEFYVLSYMHRIDMNDIYGSENVKLVYKLIIAGSVLVIYVLSKLMIMLKQYYQSKQLTKQLRVLQDSV